MKSYLSGLFANYVSLFLGTAITLFLVPYLLKHLGAELTGVYLLLMTVANFVAVGIGWLAGAGVKLIASADATKGNARVQEVHQVVFLGFLIYATVILILTTIGGLSAGHWWLSGASEGAIKQSRNSCLLLGMYIWISYVHNADLSLFTAMLRQGQANLYRAISQLFFALTAAALLAWGPRIDLLMLAQVLGVLITAIAARVHLRVNGILGPWRWHRPDPELARQMFISVGSPYFLFGLAQFVLLYADNFLIGVVLGAEAVTAYVVLWKVADFAGLLLGRISEILSPYLTRIEACGDFASLRQVFLTTSRLQHFLGLAAAFSYAAVGPWIVALWVGLENRPNSWWLYSLAAIALFFQVVNRHDLILHYAMGRVENLLVAQAIEAVIKVSLTFVLFPSLGIGAPLAAFVIIQMFGMTWWYRRAGLRLLSVSLSEWWCQVARPAVSMLMIIIISLSIIGPRVMAWSIREVLPVGSIVIAIGVLMAWWFDRRRPVIPFSTLPQLLSKH